LVAANVLDRAFRTSENRDAAAIRVAPEAIDGVPTSSVA
jgi:hypothetical protein